MRAKKTVYNSIANLLHQVVLAGAGLILPRLILSQFGSEYYGLVASVFQFIGYTALLAAGVNGATVAALFKPLAESDTLKISGITRATEAFMRKVALIFSVVLVIIALSYPLLVSDEFEWFFVFSFVLILGISKFVTFFFGAAYRMVLDADQRNYIHTAVMIGSVILNTSVASALILAGSDIRIVYFVSAFIFAINPLFLYIYVRKHYKIIRPIEPDKGALEQRWDAFALQVADFASLSAPVVILTVFTDIWEVSVFAVYYLVIRVIRLIIVNFAGAAFWPMFGNMIAKNEFSSLRKGLLLFELTNHSLATVLITCTAVLIVPFVSIFTLGVDDVNYYRPIFAVLACIAEFFNIARVPCQTVANAAGHFRQTRNAAFIEVGISITLSVVLVWQFGLIGVTIGMLCAMIFRSIIFTVYVSKHLVQRSMWVFVRRMLVSLLTGGVIFTIAQYLPEMAELTYLAWVLYALPVFVVAVLVTVLFTVLFYKEDARILCGKVRGLIRR